MQNQEVVVVAIRADGAPNIITLPPDLVVDDKRIVIHFDPVWELTKDGYDANFDILIDVGQVGDGYEHPELVLKDRYVSHKRFTKVEQYLLARTLKTSPIALPRVYRTVIGNHRTNYNALNIGATDWVVVKSLNGARGKEQALVPGHLLHTFMREAANEATLETLQKQFPTVQFTGSHSDTPDSDKMPYFYSGGFLVMEYVPDIKTEYRVLVGGSSFCIRERKINGDQYRQANVDVTTRVYDEETQYKGLEELLSWEEARSVRRLAQHVGLNLGSMDLYRTENGLGLFEFSPQFAHAATYHETIRNLHVDYLVDVVRSVLDQY